jgi:ABC-type phosphate transport system substrate-binding protein
MLRLIISFLTLLVVTPSHADIAVVVGRNSVIDKLDEREIAGIFLSKITHLADGNHVTPIELRDSAYRAMFYREISGKTLPQLNSYWTTLIFTGKGKPPRSIDEEKQLIELLNSDPKAISYVPVGPISSMLRILHVFH